MAWGWVPATEEGWLVLVVFLFAFIVMMTPFVHLATASAFTVVQYLVEVATWIVSFFLVCTITGESPKWQWGVPKKRRAPVKRKKAAQKS